MTRQVQILIVLAVVMFGSADYVADHLLVVDVVRRGASNVLSHVWVG